jgi:hypothetical protein
MQTVFTDVARKASSLARCEYSTGWLYTCAHFICEIFKSEQTLVRCCFLLRLRKFRRSSVPAPMPFRG